MSRNHYYSTHVLFLCALATLCVCMVSRADEGVVGDGTVAPPQFVRQIQRHCLDCHSGMSAEGNLNLETLIPVLENDPTTIELAPWIKIHDRVVDGEMPPDSGSNDGSGSSWDEKDRNLLVTTLKQRLNQIDRAQIARAGRAVWRRMNRFEYENSVRDLLDAPWLQLASILPEDGERYRFNKVGEALDVSHVSMARYLQAANYALSEVMARKPMAPQTETVRYYAREQGSFNRRVHFNVFNRSPERATFPLLGYDADLNVLRNPEEPFTAGASDPEKREREAFGVVASSYEPIEIRFSDFEAPRSGRYKLRFKGYTFWAAAKDEKRFRADRERTSIGRRSEPVTIYSQSPPRQLRRLGQFDFQIEPSVQELDVYLLKGESIQPDAVRLFRSRPPAWRNPLAEKEGMPGVAFNWMEVEGPVIDQWPPAGHRLMFDELPIAIVSDKAIVQSNQPMVDARRLMRRFIASAYRRPVSDDDVNRFTGVVQKALDGGMEFTDAMMAGYSAVLCSPSFLCMEETPGHLESSAIASRLSLFLWNSAPDEPLLALAGSNELENPTVLKSQIDRMLDDGSFDRFVDAFLAYWLDLRRINDTSPDELLYPDYYLDDALVDASLQETRLFFAELIRENLPVRNLIDSDFTFVNERLAKHYGLPANEGAALRRTVLPPDSVRGGLLTQASVLKVTANGTTTSPVVRGVWVNERILGQTIPAPPPSVPAIEPDTRGATTIREQLRLHRADESCNTCHRIIDPAGFALECFDVSGGYRENYRSFNGGQPMKGFGKNGQPFTFSAGPIVDPSGELPDGRGFANVREFKRLLLTNERSIARNLVEKLVTYATGAGPRFSDRETIEQILDRHQQAGFPIRSLIVEVASSPLFLNK